MDFNTNTTGYMVNKSVDIYIFLNEMDQQSVCSVLFV